MKITDKSEKYTATKSIGNVAFGTVFRGRIGGNSGGNQYGRGLWLQTGAGQALIQSGNGHVQHFNVVIAGTEVTEFQEYDAELVLRSREGLS